MMGRITTDQSHQIISTLIANVQWDEIDFYATGLQDAVIRNPREAGRRFTEWLKNGAQTIGSVFLAVFWAIKVGTTGMRTADDFRTALQEAGLLIDDWANDLLSRPGFTVARREELVNLVVITTSQLTGRKDGGVLTAVFAGAARIGLEVCQPEDGPLLRLQYLDQPLYQSLTIGMLPISSSGVGSLMFCLEHDRQGLKLGVSSTHSEMQWSGEHLWVFRHRESWDKKARAK
jgi:hypothetical protein